MISRYLPSLGKILLVVGHVSFAVAAIGGVANAETPMQQSSMSRTDLVTQGLEEAPFEQASTTASCPNCPKSTPSSISLAASGLISWSYSDNSTPSHHLVEYRKIDAPSGQWLKATNSVTNTEEAFELAIYQGDAVEISRHPYQVYVALFVGRYRAASCGGVLLTPIWVLTAAHCTYSTSYPGFQAKVGFGKSKISELADEDWRESSNVFRYSGYLPEVIQNDVGLIKLKSPVDMTRAGTIPIFDLDQPVTGEFTYATGWGRLSKGGLSPDHLRGVELQTVPGCGNWATRLPSFRSESVICAGTSSGASICQGDSGGPLVINRNGLLYLAGITSFTGSQVFECDSSYLPSAFARASAFKTWVETYTGPLWTQLQTFDAQVANISDFDASAQYAIRIRPSNYSSHGIQKTWLLSAGQSQSNSQPSVAGKEGYWLLEEDGQVYNFGSAGVFGDPSTLIASRGLQAVDIEATGTGNGYWILDTSGRFNRFGDATLIPQASLGGLKPHYDFSLVPDQPEKIVSSIPTSSGLGAYVFTNIGRVIRTGDALPIYDEVGREDLLWIPKLNGPIVDARLSSDRAGYWMLSSDGGIFTFGNASFFGAVPEKPREQWFGEQIISFAPDLDGAGYVVVAGSGKAWWFNFAERPQLPDVLRAAFGSSKLNSPIVAVMTRSCGGYLMVANDGGVFATPMSDCGFQGSLGANPPNTRIVALSPK